MPRTWTDSHAISLIALFLAVATLRAGDSDDPPEVRVGERFFRESRFARRFFADGKGDPNWTGLCAEPALAQLSARAGVPSVRGPFSNQAISCRACHLVDEMKDRRDLSGHGVSAYNDYARLSPIPVRDDDKATTPRNSPALVDVVGCGATLLHFDGEFASAEDLVKSTYTGRNFGWLPSEHGLARSHFARVIREDRAGDDLAKDYGRIAYGVLLRGVDPVIPAELRLPKNYRFDPANATDDEILDGCARLVTAYMASLRYSRDPAGLHNGSPYDAFLEANGLPRGPRAGESARSYTDRLKGAIALVAAPRFVDARDREFKYHDQPFRFGELEWRGLGIFFRTSTRDGAAGGAGNCAACHLPPHFTDFSFHNTGVTQDDFDAVNGAGSFARLIVPALGDRNAAPVEWLPPTPQHPEARAPFLSLTRHVDLGLWNVCGHPDLPVPQAAIVQQLNPDGRLTPDEVLACALARFKTPGLRDLGQTPPYLHTGQFLELEETVRFYQRMSQLAQAGKMRNAPSEFSGIRLRAEDIPPLVAFLKSLNEDYD